MPFTFQRAVSAMAIFGLALLVVPLADTQSGPSAPAGSSNMAHLYLFEKDQATWEIVEGGAWGKMLYNLTGNTFDFNFNGHRLNQDTNYTLIYYPDPWPGSGLICFGSGTADSYGDVKIKGSASVVVLPATYDANDEAKIWLVLSSDVNCDSHKMVSWNGAEYLFELTFITFNALED